LSFGVARKVSDMLPIGLARVRMHYKSVVLNTLLHSIAHQLIVPSFENAANLTRASFFHAENDRSLKVKCKAIVPNQFDILEESRNDTVPVFLLRIVQIGMDTIGKSVRNGSDVH
jgi:hypothetical protein